MPVRLSPFGKGVAKEAETLAKFKSRIDQVLIDLENSPAAKKNIDEQRITRAAYGGDIDSASDLSLLYDQVHEKLKTWSKIFGDQLEAMGITALIAEKGIDGTDAEQRRRLQQIQAESAKYYRDPKPKAEGSDGGNHTKHEAY